MEKVSYGVLKENPHIVYYQPYNAKSVAINLFKFGYTQFATTYLYIHRDIFKSLCFDNPQNHDFNIQNYSELFLNRLNDAIKITICIENFLKGFLLGRDYLVHEIDNNILPELHKKQKQEPIEFSEFFKESKLIVDPKLSEEIPNKKYYGLTNKTIGIKTLTNKGYSKFFNLTDEFINNCKTYFEYRNWLHFYFMEELIVNVKDYEQFEDLIRFVNNNIVRIFNIVINDIENNNPSELLVELEI